MLLWGPPRVVLVYIAGSHVQNGDAALVYIGREALESVANMYITFFVLF